MTNSVSVQARRQLYLDALYGLDHRDHPAHPHYHCYTGLFQARLQQLMPQAVEQDMQLLLGGSDDR